MSSFKSRLKSGSTLSHPNARPASPAPPVNEIDESEMVERHGNEIQICFPPFPPFRIPVGTAKKFAYLILSRCEGATDGESEGQSHQ